MIKEVRMTSDELKEFFATLKDDERDLFFTLLAVGESAEFTRDYILCVRE